MPLVVSQIDYEEAIEDMFLGTVNSDTVTDCAVGIWISVVNYLIDKGVRVHFHESTWILQSSCSCSILSMSMYHPDLSEVSKQRVEQFISIISEGVRGAMTRAWQEYVQADDLTQAVDLAISMLPPLIEGERQEFFQEIAFSENKPEELWSDYVPKIIEKFVTNLSPLQIPGGSPKGESYSLSERDSKKLQKVVAKRLLRLK